MIRLYPDGDKEYYNNEGLLHREDGPAVIYKNGPKCWYLNGKRHRIDGPAIERPNSINNNWFYHGKFIHVTSQQEFERYIKLLVFR